MAIIALIQAIYAYVWSRMPNLYLALLYLDDSYLNSSIRRARFMTGSCRQLSALREGNTRREKGRVLNQEVFKMPIRGSSPI
jgi:hypothetical protein